MVNRAALATGMLMCSVLLAVASGCSLAGRIPGGGDAPEAPEVKGPHRVAAAGPDGAAAHHWIALGRDWAVPTGDPANKTTSTAIGTDGSRVFLIESQIPHGVDPWPPGTLTAYDAAHGGQLWTHSFQWSGADVPVGGGGVVILATSTRKISTVEAVDYVAFDATSGAQRWRRRVSHPVLSPIDLINSAPGVMLGGVFYYVDGSDTYGIDPASGKVVRHHHSTAAVVEVGPVVVGNRLALVTGHLPGESGNSRLNVVNADFSLASSYEYEDTTTAPNCAGMLSAEEDIIVSWSSSVICAVDPKTGRLLWSQPYQDREPSPVVDGVIPFFQDQDDVDPVIGVDARTGNQLWTSPAPHDKNIGLGTVRTGIAVVDGTLFSLGHHVGIIDPHTGKTIFDMKPVLGTKLTGGRGTYGANTYGGDALPVLAAGHIVMSRADGVWGFR